MISGDVAYTVPPTYSNVDGDIKATSPEGVAWAEANWDSGYARAIAIGRALEGGCPLHAHMLEDGWCHCDEPVRFAAKLTDEQAVLNFMWPLADNAKLADEGVLVWPRARLDAALGKEARR